MRESRSYGSVGEREGNDPLYPELNEGKAEAKEELLAKNVAFDV
jgi:hypothetical protein